MNLITLVLATNVLLHPYWEVAENYEIPHLPGSNAPSLYFDVHSVDGLAYDIMWTGDLRTNWTRLASSGDLFYGRHIARVIMHTNSPVTKAMGVVDSGFFYVAPSENGSYIWEVDIGEL